MCIIACKPVGLEMPIEKVITNMWTSNPDGTGIMYSHNGKVEIEKGFMKLDDFLTALDRLDKRVNLKQCGVVMHFRIATHGGTCPENTHPFPISSSISVLKKLKITTDVGVAHNGIISISTRSRDISDTMEYIASQLAPLKAALPRFWENKDALLLVKNAIASKMAFLDGKGNIRTVGDFTEDEGMLYSNGSYKDTYWKNAGWSSYYGWDWDSKAGKWTNDVYSPEHTTLYGDEYDAYSDITSPHYLMPIMDVDGSCYSDLKGVLHEDTNYEVFIDYRGRVWTVDWSVGIAYLDDTITGVYDAQGMRLKYDYQLAELIDCYDWDGNLLCLPN